ncbi:NUDIX domain-containing protein [uncultured Ruminococcus sp.]|uniref:NUDIX domain-containing protein n=1 Tax=uncultured Ruminococcus sp. TaxID=165186 RepID=UPI000EE25257|nr:NUDIX hydrolase [uncultured Ruminococcus sp.]HCJ40944.1 ADP-ribose pyrophosphatase [Ruminococcus sp.]
MYQKEKALSSEQLFDGIVVKLFRDDVELENGEKAVREYVKHPGGVCVAAVDDDENIYMVEQFRYPFGKALTEVPAGKLEYGEDPAQCGRRELKEEVGAVADSFEYLGCLYPTVAYDTEIIHMFLARGLHFGEQHLDDGEFLDVKKMPLKEAYKLVMENKMPDAKTQMAVMKAYLKLHGEV